jgi:hypothetical protein
MRAVEYVQNDIRPLLDSSWGDEVDRDFEGPKYDTLRDKGIIVWSTVTWELTKEANAWMPKTFVHMLISRGFVCELYRTDIWIFVRMFPTPFSVAVKRRMKWTELSTSKNNEWVVDILLNEGRSARCIGPLPLFLQCARLR